MKIAFVNQPIDGVRPPHQNSLGIWTYEVARALAPEHEVLIYLYGGGHRFRSLLEDGIHYRFVPHETDQRIVKWSRKLPRVRDPRRPHFAAAWYHWKFARAVAQDLARQRCDVAHILNFSQFGPPIRRANPGLKLALHMQCEWAVQLDPAMMAQRIEKFDLVLGCSDFIAQQIRDAFPQFADRCQCVYNGVDYELFSPSAESHASRFGPPCILFVARVSPEKGVHVLLDAFSTIQERYPAARLDLAGAVEAVPYEFVVALSRDPKVKDLGRFYEGNYGETLRRQVSPAAVDRVRFLGNLPYSHLIQLYRNADVFVFPSVWDEPFGMPIVEAMACGVPVVATRGGGIPELVSDPDTGLLVERGDAASLAAAILRLLEDPGLRKKMGAAARARARRLFGWKTIAESLLDRYRQIARDA